MKTQYARLNRQFIRLSETINQLMENGEWQNLSKSVQQRFAQKLRNRFSSIRSFFPKRRLIQTMGAAAVLVGFASTSQAQISFKAPVSNPFNLKSIGSVAAPAFGDIDNDGDLDLFVGDYNGNINYIENTGTATNPSFAERDSTAFGLTQNIFVQTPKLVDIDNDGDLDLFVGFYTYGQGHIAFYENTGTATAAAFASPDTNAFGITPATEFAVPEFADIDGDGDYDLMVAEAYGNRLYFENTGTKSAPAFAAAVTNPFGLSPNPSGYVTPLIFVDLDNDGDLDILESGYYGDFHYYENSGTATNPAFSAHQLNPFNLNYSGTDGLIHAMADIDGDGDIDLLGGEYYGDFTYFENETVTGIETRKSELNISLFPTITTGEVNLRFNGTLPDRIEVRNALGQLIDVQRPENTTGSQIQLSGKAGMYFIHVFDTKGGASVHQVVKQ